MSPRRLFLVIVVAMATACSGGSAGPTNPGPVVTPPPDPGPVVNNTPPVVGRVMAQGTLTNEPPNFANASEALPVSVEVKDAESAIGDLKFNWSAAVGSFTGTGPTVIWKAPAEVAAPSDVTINVEVVETYTSQGKSVQNTVTGSVVVSLHDSIKEVSDMARQFLLDFSDSSKDVATTMRNFQPGCYGTDEEAGQVGDNRSNYFILDSNVGTPKTTVAFGGFCSFRDKAGDACARVPVYWNSLAKKNVYNQFTGELDVPAGETRKAGPAVDQVAANYYRDQRRWKLCDSQFDPDHTSLRAASIRGLVP